MEFSVKFNSHHIYTTIILYATKKRESQYLAAGWFAGVWHNHIAIHENGENTKSLIIQTTA